MKYILIFMLMSLASPAFCKEVSLIEGTSKVKSKADGKVIDQRDDFFIQEEKRLKAIRLLNLDLEQADLELKHMEIAQKMENLSSLEGVTPSPKSAPSVTSIKVIAILLSDGLKEGVLAINGTTYTVHERDTLNTGHTVTAIGAQGIRLEKNGIEETLSL